MDKRLEDIATLVKEKLEEIKSNPTIEKIIYVNKSQYAYVKYNELMFGLYDLLENPFDFFGFKVRLKK